MLELVSQIGGSVIFNLIQLILGCLISIGIKISAGDRLIKKESSKAADVMIIVGCSIIGMLLPLGTYGLLVPVICLTIIGIKPYFVLPILVSNAMFNMIVPFNDVSFIWRTGIRRIILALIAGILVGIAFKFLNLKREEYFREGHMPVMELKTLSMSGLVGYIGEGISFVGLYLIIGAIADTFFRKYAFFSIIDFIFSSNQTAFIPKFVAEFNVTNPLFLLSKSTAMMLLDLIKLSALFVLLKPKGILLYYGIYVFLAAVLSVSAFI